MFFVCCCCFCDKFSSTQDVPLCPTSLHCISFFPPVYLSSVLFCFSAGIFLCHRLLISLIFLPSSWSSLLLCLLSDSPSDNPKCSHFQFSLSVSHSVSVTPSISYHSSRARGVAWRLLNPYRSLSLPLRVWIMNKELCRTREEAGEMRRGGGQRCQLSEMDGADQGLDWQGKW